MTKNTEEERKKKLIDWTKQHLEPWVKYLNTFATLETTKIYTGTRDFLVATLVGVFIGVLTNVSAEYLVAGEIDIGFVTLILSVVIAMISFYLWRLYLVKDLQQYTRKLFYEIGESLKEEFEKNFGISSSKG